MIIFSVNFDCHAVSSFWDMNNMWAIDLIFWAIFSIPSLITTYHGTYVLSHQLDLDCSWFTSEISPLDGLFFARRIKFIVFKYGS